MLDELDQCCICKKAFSHESRQHGLHDVHSEDCFSYGHFNPFEDGLFDTEDEDLEHISCMCTILYAHADCCPSCIDLGYDHNLKYVSDQESTDY
jgi:hypothetical protein